MAIYGIGNFGFMYELDPEIYKHLHSAECNARISMNSSIYNSIRKALERFISVVIEKNNLSDYVLKAGKPLTAGTLWVKICALSNEKEMRRAGFLKNSETFDNKTLLPYCQNDYTVDFKLKNPINGAYSATAPYYSYIRLFGNACSHIDDGKKFTPEFSYNNLILSLKIFHKILKSYYKLSNIPDFNDRIMPIGKYIIDDAQIPSDCERSKCELEFDAHINNQNGEPESYALLRLYNKNSVNEVFMRRNNDCFLEIARSYLGNIPQGFTAVNVLTDEDSECEFFIIAYTFYCKAEPLSTRLLSKLNLNQRLQLCKYLAICLDELHNTHIYHRLLNYDCVYVVHSNDRYIPVIVKFDYAKIDMRNKVTVSLFAELAKKRLVNSSLNKYIPEEWKNKEFYSTDVDWSKVDVYSLGMLMGDIIIGKLESPNIVDFNILEDMEVSEKIIDTIEVMLAQKPKFRCTMNQVRNVFEQEIN